MTKFMTKNEFFQSLGTKNELFKVLRTKNELHAKFRDENNRLTFMIFMLTTSKKG
jgi:hypothetical protein